MTRCGSRVCSVDPRFARHPATGIPQHNGTMKSRPPTGTLGELRFVVGAEHVIDFATDDMPAVLSTPRLIGLIERTARESLYPFLEPDERTVGLEIELRHF